MLRKLLVLLGLFGFAFTGYKISDVTIEAFQPKGFRVYIPDEPGIKLFAFQGKISSKFNVSRIGEFSGNIRKPTGGYWVYEKPDEVLEIGDTLNYWVIVQIFDTAYQRSDNWKVSEYAKNEQLGCSSETLDADDTSMCQGSVIFEDNFETIDQSKWLIEHYIPSRGPSFEFNSYENSEDTVFIKNDVLRIRPVPKKFSNEIRGTLDLRFQCTRIKYPEECFCPHVVPPVRSGKIRSKFSFQYGKVEVRAKLPAGDWIFPEFSLVPANKVDSDGANATKIWIGYARGNEKLIGNAGDDIGGTILFSGEVLSPYEPVRSSRLVSIRGAEAYTRGMHLYTLIWKPDKITAYVDNILIGEKAVSSPIGKSVLSLGVGVGGVTDFPDGYRSGTTKKPWMNGDEKRIRNFFNARNEWLPTWHHPATEFQVDYVKIYAL